MSSKGSRAGSGTGSKAGSRAGSKPGSKAGSKAGTPRSSKASTPKGGSKAATPLLPENALVNGEGDEDNESLAVGETAQAGTGR